MSPIKAIAYAGSLWVGSLITFYLFVPALGFTFGYNTSPIAISFFYLAWIMIAVITFRDEYRRHVPSMRSFMDDSYLSILFGFGAWLFLFALSHTTVPQFVHPIEPVTDLLLATPWYFLPKSVEILFQQMLIAVMVFSIARYLPLRGVVLIYGLLFGSTHLLLLFGGQFPPTVLIMTLAAVTSAAFFPYLLLKTRHGFVYCYMIHWTFYAALVLALRIFAN